MPGRRRCGRKSQSSSNALVAYLNIWCAILIFPAGLIAFFHEGLFAYDGVGAFWIPFAVFFGWMITMSVTTLQTINRQKSVVAGEDQPAAVVG